MPRILLRISKFFPSMQMISFPVTSHNKPYIPSMPMAVQIISIANAVRLMTGAFPARTTISIRSPNIQTQNHSTWSDMKGQFLQLNIVIVVVCPCSSIRHRDRGESSVSKVRNSFLFSWDLLRGKRRLHIPRSGMLHVINGILDTETPPVRTSCLWAVQPKFRGTS